MPITPSNKEETTPLKESLRRLQEKKNDEKATGDTQHQKADSVGKYQVPFMA